MRVLEFSPEDRALLKGFVRFGGALYARDPYYVYPLEVTLLGSRVLGIRGLLTGGHPFHRRATVRYFMVFDGERPLGRIACCLNSAYNEFYGSSVGHFGFFEVCDDELVSRMLFERACAWFREHKVTSVQGPYNFSVNETVGLLIDGFDSSPRLGTVYNFPYYQKHIEAFGFQKEKDLLSLRFPVQLTPLTQARHDRLTKLHAWLKRRYNCMTRSIASTRKGFLQDLKLIYDLYTHIWKNNWGYIPMQEEEFINATKELKLFYDPSLIRFAYADGKVVAFIVILPDVHDIQKQQAQNRLDFIKILEILLKRRQICNARVVLFGVFPEFRNKGFDMLLFHECFMIAAQAGYKECEASWILEENTTMIHAVESLGGQLYKRWRIFSVSL